MLNRVLVANRGEIAVRIIRACHEMDIEAVAVYSTADKDSLAVKVADRAICIGGPSAKDSYLNIQNILSAAVNTDCDAVHPGYGLLSERDDFAFAIKSCGLKFIGPDSKVIALMGQKSAARDLMKKAGVAVIPGSDGDVKSFEDAKKIAAKIGFPLLIKAVYGGGGKGIRRVDSMEELEEHFIVAKSEAKANFGSDEVYMERLIENPRHVEIQILADKFGNTIHLGERECSIQHRHQKMLEEAPSTAVGESLREEMGRAAVKAAEACNYEGAGTVEFLLDEDLNYYFIEMNTRIQVEHPVTEMVTGIDIVKEQLRIASGLKLRYKQEEVALKGHAIECRLNAVDSFKDFMPSTGTLKVINTPGGFNTRFDSAIYSGLEVSPYYDSMLGKIIVHAPTRLEAIKKMRRALEETIIEGVRMNQGILYAVTLDKDFIRGEYNVGFLEEKLDEILDYSRSFAEHLESLI